jgi:RNA polymerase sigma-70 factor, ECF subfamily
MRKQAKEAPLPPDDAISDLDDATAKLHGSEAGLRMITPLEERLSGYFHYFGVRGAFLLQLGRAAEARVAFDRAIALANTPAEAAHIRRHLDSLTRTG